MNADNILDRPLEDALFALPEPFNPTQYRHERDVIEHRCPACGRLLRRGACRRHGTPAADCGQWLAGDAA